VWWYEVAAVLWSCVTTSSGERAEPYPVQFEIPQSMVDPIPGEDYARVPTVDELAPRPWAVVWALGPVEGPRGVLHRADCHQGRYGRLMTDDQAREAVAAGDVAPCTVCRPERAPTWRPNTGVSRSGAPERRRLQGRGG
jgi:uncharacterized protein DUF6233